MPLLTIADLEDQYDEIQHYLTRVQKLSDMYIDYIAHDPGGFSYTVEVTEEKARAPGIHASEASGCLRRLVYGICGEEKKAENRDANMIMRFRIGTAAHAMLQNDFHRIASVPLNNLDFTDEAPISPKLGGPAAEHRIYSSCDGIFTFTDKDRTPVVRCGLEIKTASPGEYEKLQNPKLAHFEQTCIYMACLDLPLMWILYYNKGNQNFTSTHPPYLYQFDRALWGRLEMRFVKANLLAEQGALPDREEGMPCKWCPYSWTCKPSILNMRRSQPLSQGMKQR